ncbi:AAA family ATPase [Terrilactibacillus sp. BCM23-1]|uniref:AAA family ATPase n=1 Tax=Terrilactibacillus tamarindi TaxID=2599694 RepID=A0A6N8CT58_9BACI|nr:AAA family ATPase [Terrilactibacillus tamarindi]MTT32900.1 AAA family ATPase [Terrilactibacillus tamarindi]
MTESYTFTQKSQINVIFNQKKANDTATLPHYREERLKHQPLELIESKLSKLIGLEEVKKVVKEIYAWIYVNQRRGERNLKVPSQSLHMLFKGNPGTGKTTVARLLGELLCDMEILSKGHLIEAERADLVGEYIGQTAQKTRELVKKAKGGILFIDEAYSLARGGEKDFGKEAIDTLVKQMEDLREDFILILAGYSDEMEDFLSQNPGLPSRFPIIISFPNYSGSELLLIAHQMLDEQEYKLTSEAEKKLKRYLDIKSIEENESFSNGRFVRNLIEKMIRQQAVRLLREGRFDRESLLTVRACDLIIEENKEVGH